MRMLAERLKPARRDRRRSRLVVAVMEAQAFAYLAVRTLDGLPMTFPSTTGVKQPMKGGIPEPCRKVDRVPDLEQFQSAIARRLD